MRNAATAKPLLVMFVGVPGSGKTTFAKQLSKQRGAVLLASDSVRMAMWGSREEIDKSHATPEERRYNNQLVFGALDYSTEQIVASGYSVIYDCNANRRAERNEKYEIADRHDAQAVVVRIKVPYDVSLLRIQERVEAHDARRFDGEKARQVLAQFTAEIEEPTGDELYVEIDGQVSFSEQLAQFYEQLAAKGIDIAQN